MKRIDLTFQTVNMIRREKNPPLSRYCIMLAIAAAGRPLTLMEITAAMGGGSCAGGSFDSIQRLGLAVKIADERGKYTWDLTAAGKEEVERIMTAKHPKVVR